MTGLFDSDVLIDFFQGVEPAAIELDRYSTRLISRISWIEAQVGARSDEERSLRASFLNLKTGMAGRVARENGGRAAVRSGGGTAVHPERSNSASAGRRP
ncbi:MAG: hypothetical protein QOE70_1384, partial [Chthoniobacter sp.]|nr:hypothetical protein [Chthoniobacter sp.]